MDVNSFTVYSFEIVAANISRPLYAMAKNRFPIGRRITLMVSDKRVKKTKRAKHETNNVKKIKTN